jgi:transposase
MGKIKKLELTESQRLELENGFRNGTSHCFRMRCRSVLLKGAGLSSAKAGAQTEMSFVSVNSWVKRFLSEGISGLETRPGRGRKPIMDCSDEQAVRTAIEQDRQSVSKAKVAWQEATGKEASESTFKRFLSALAQDISV